MSFDPSMFDFSAMSQALGANPFEQATNKFAHDDRFYTLTKDDNGNGAAQIMFLPDSDKHMIQKVYKINTTITKDGKKRFVSELSPTTIDRPCPFQEKWSELYNAGKQTDAKLFSRTQRYYVNILVINDFAKPQNNGQVFLYDMSKTMTEKLRSALEPSEQDIAFGAQRKEIFNPLKGWTFLLKAKKGSNGMITYDDSEFRQYEGPNGQTYFGNVDAANIQATAEKVVAFIKEKTYNLNEFLDPKSYKTYEELKSKLDWVTFGQTSSAPVAETAQVQVAQAQVQVPEVQAVAQTAQTQVPPVQTTPAPATPGAANPAPQAAPAQSGGFDVNSFINAL